MFIMSSTSSRPPLKTYSKTYSKRKHQNSGDDILKRRRVSLPDNRDYEPAPSSDLPSSDTAIFSDENIPPSTPPSSPPSIAVSPKHRSSSDKLGGADHAKASTKPVAKPHKRLVQMQLNFGQSMSKACKDCGMEYVPSAPEDAALHKKFHAQHANGVTMDRDFLKKVESDKALWRGPRGALIMSLNGSRDPKSWLKKARAVFDMATTDLGAVDIPDEKLWGPKQKMTKSCRSPSTDVTEDATTDRYKLYLYVDGGRCVGLCLAEYIDRAYQVLEPKKSMQESEGEKADVAVETGSELLTISEKADKAVLGISRIWTSRASRGKGIARALLNCVAKTFDDGKATPKDLVAFSQPTEMGTGLARRWFGQQSGWHVYID